MRLSRFVRILLATIAIGFLVYYVDPRSMARAAAGADLKWLAAAVLLMPLNVLLEGWVWHLIARRIDPRTTPAESFGALFTGFALGFFTPGRTGEFAGRAFYVQYHDKWEVAAGIAVQRLLDMAVAISIGAICLALFVVRDAPTPRMAWIVLVAVSFTIGLLLVAAGLAPGAAHRVLVRLLPSDAVKRRVRFLGALTAREGARILALDAVRFGVYVTQFFLLLRALVPSAEPVSGYLGVVLTFLAKFMVPSLTFMDLGVREGAAVFFLGRMGYPEAAALSASLLIFAINLLVPAAVGIRFVLKLRVSSVNEWRPQVSKSSKSRGD